MTVIIFFSIDGGYNNQKRTIHYIMRVVQDVISFVHFLGNKHQANEKLL